MKLYLKYILAVTLLPIAFTLGVNAQDIHFSQYYNTKNLQNVANSGLMSDRDYRVSAVYRTQWSAIPAPFTTMALTGDFQVLHNESRSNWLGIGFNILNDRSGTGNLNLYKAGVATAYHIMLSEGHLLSLGLGTSINRRSIDFNKLSFDTQWDGYTFNKTLPNGEPRLYEKDDYMDIQTGVNYSFFPNANSYYKLGVALGHINRPLVSLIGGNQRLSLRPVFTADAILNFGQDWNLAPSVYYTYMQEASQAILGATISKDINASFKGDYVRISAGLYHRLGRDMITSVGISYNKTTLTASYDFTTSSLRKANNGNGAFEISFIYEGIYKSRQNYGNSPFTCPRF